MQGTHDIDENDDSQRRRSRWIRVRRRALLAQSTRDAQRQFDPRPPVLMALMGAVVLAAYGVLWLSTRGQHPYSGPSGGAIVFTYAVVVVTSVAMVKLHRRATDRRQRRLDQTAAGRGGRARAVDSW